MKSIYFFLFATLLLARNTAYSQNDLTIGKSFKINSESLNEEREFYVYLPDGYDTLDKSYPVLYILDGQWFFTNGVAIQRSLRVPDRLPEMIVVGIKNQNPQRRTLFWGDRDKCLSFMVDELGNYMEENYRVSEDRILFGWEAAAYFASWALLHESQYYSAAIVTNGGYASEEEVKNYANFETKSNRYLFMANSLKDIYYVGSSEAFSEILDQHAPDHLTWEYQLFNDEIHESLAHIALYHGLTNYYHNFSSLVFSSIAKYNELGGMDYLEEYFQQRGERYGFPPEIDNSTKNSLIWLSWNRDDFESFDFFMTEFADVLSTRRYANAYWQNRLAQFYLKHNDTENAIRYFSTGITQYPEPNRLAEMHCGLGNAYLKQEKRKEAKKNLKLAFEIAQDNNDPDLEHYKSELEKLKK